jgi:hypothetical protein
MKLARILSIFLAVVFLMSTTGIFIIHHTCLRTGYDKIALTENFDCCSSCNIPNNVNRNFNIRGQNNSTNHHDNCCTNHYYYLKNASKFISPDKSSTKSHFFRTFGTYIPVTPLLEAYRLQQQRFWHHAVFPSMVILKLSGKLLL